MSMIFGVSLSFRMSPNWTSSSPTRQGPWPERVCHHLRWGVVHTQEIWPQHVRTERQAVASPHDEDGGGACHNYATPLKSTPSHAVPSGPWPFAAGPDPAAQRPGGRMQKPQGPQGHFNQWVTVGHAMVMPCNAMYYSCHLSSMLSGSQWSFQFDDKT